MLHYLSLVQSDSARLVSAWGLFIALPLEGVAAHQYQMRDDSEAEHVALLTVSLAENFRSHISHSAAFGPPWLLPQGRHLERKPKIYDFHLVSVDVDDDVLGLEVAMDDAALVALPHSHQNVS